MYEVGKARWARKLARLAAKEGYDDRFERFRDEIRAKRGDPFFEALYQASGELHNILYERAQYRALAESLSEEEAIALLVLFEARAMLDSEFVAAFGAEVLQGLRATGAVSQMGVSYEPLPIRVSSQGRRLVEILLGKGFRIPGVQTPRSRLDGEEFDG